ncbi:hypothetical protein [Planococcus lenghuensis]|uniref:Uncharacterized protein n=1 Tax=Planococcus lenghuensis TaxID=2213202 RepID=A0A1Q2KZD7_9BACL|nr:hypothetical protein [Planococcus lenghuensis]AQQ53565.1 hypothetical protein B0X71_11100 [Planococcus lenghuensis]
MRKYWKSIAIAASIVLSIGTFYATSAKSAEHYPEFVIQPLSGDIQEVKHLVLEGMYINPSSMNYINSNLKITVQGSSYNSRSILDQLIGNYPTVIKKFQEDYHTFMRGKDPVVSLYFEDSEFLAYANADYTIDTMGPEDFEFEIAVLNKDDGTVNSFAVEVPDGGGLDHIFVEDVQLVENKLYLITQNMVRKNDSFNEEKHIYEIDLDTQNLISHETLAESAQSKENIHTYTRLVENSPTAANEQIILLKTEETVTEEIESIRMTDFKQEIVFYDLATKETETVNVPGLSLEENQLSLVEGSTLYFTRVEEQELIVTPYRLGENQVDRELRIQLQSAMEKGLVPFLSVKEGKLYVVSPQINSKSNGDITVVDMQTGETLFKGQIALKTPSEEKGDFELHLHEIHVK